MFRIQMYLSLTYYKASSWVGTFVVTDDLGLPASFEWNACCFLTWSRLSLDSAVSQRYLRTRWAPVFGCPEYLKVRYTSEKEYLIITLESIDRSPPECMKKKVKYDEYQMLAGP